MVNFKSIPIYVMAVFTPFLFNSCVRKTENNIITPIPIKNINVKGELSERIRKNFDRLEEGKYQPDSVFLSEEESGSWPGDNEGRTILGVVMDAQASKREPKYLNEIIKRIPAYLNEKGYMGPVYENMMNEQQLSGNGWMLRALCEYYEWKKDDKVLSIISSISHNLFVKGKGYYKDYPIEPEKRNSTEGKEAGNIDRIKNNWMLSTDIGCVFIGMDGAIQAYKLLKDPELKEVIDEMISAFLKIDLVAIKAQTHATLSACRGLVRYAEITEDKCYIDEAAKRWNMYRENGMTENYENYNWFGRFDKWTEPCAIIDSYMLGVQLWQHTQDNRYLRDAELIYYNGICHTQRENGGFGCDNTPGKEIHDFCLKVHVDEAYWCCTMRGGEGLSRAAQYSYFMDDEPSLYIPFLRESELAILFGKKQFCLVQNTDYPFDNRMKLTITDNSIGKIAIKINLPTGTSKHQIKYNGKEIPLVVKNNFAIVKKKFKSGDTIDFTFEPDIIITNETVNSSNVEPGQLKLFWGPLMLGCENGEAFKLTKEDRLIQVKEGLFKIEGKEVFLTPIYHLMAPKVNKHDLYKKQILF